MGPALRLLFLLGHLDPAEKVGDANPKLWCALHQGKVVVFDASSWTIHQHCVRVGTSKLVSEAGNSRCGRAGGWAALGQRPDPSCRFGKANAPTRARHCPAPSAWKWEGFPVHPEFIN